MDEKLIDLSSIPMREAVIKVAEKARQVMEKDGYHHPLVICAGEETFVAVPDLTSPEAKAASMKAIAEQASEEKAKRVFVISEAWGVAFPEDLKTRPSKHPRREEVLMVSGKDEGGQVIVAFMSVTRRGEKVMLGSVRIYEPGSPDQDPAPLLRAFFSQEKEG